MNFKFHAFATVTFPSPSSNPTSKALVPPNLSKLYLLNRQNPKPHLSIYKTLESTKCPRLQIRATANNQGESGNWTKWLPRGGMAPGSGSLTGKITYHNAFWISCILGLSFSLDSPNTSMDDRSHGGNLFAIAKLRSVLAFSSGGLFKRHLLALAKHLCFNSCDGNGAPPLVQLRTPPPAMMGLPNLPDSLGGYSYLVMKLGPLQLTRKAYLSKCEPMPDNNNPRATCICFVVFMRPLRFIGVPVAEITLTLLLSLRFISLVFDEVRNVALGIISRRINWQQLTTMETIDIFVSYVRRIFKNIFSHAEQISQFFLYFIFGFLQAMIVRGFRGDSSTHKLYFLSDSSIRMEDVVSLLCLIGIIGAAVLSEYLLV
ncbi:Protein ABCI12, chloroplastic [Vitis vinifera]|uniref:Protein ABCI12, chloroplastic n=1 Tax=Vitis vinifera TaxID=29760 RepID=A0A438KKK9_VITVI|nr:Protein ABCI12, chloroplastic [Vitis vinifera]